MFYLEHLFLINYTKVAFSKYRNRDEIYVRKKV